MNNRDSTPIVPIVIEDPICHDKLGLGEELAAAMERISHWHGQAQTCLLDESRQMYTIKGCPVRSNYVARLTMPASLDQA